MKLEINTVIMTKYYKEINGGNPSFVFGAAEILRQFQPQNVSPITEQ